MASLPIPNVKYVPLDLFYIQYELNGTYKNYKLQIKIKDTDRVADLRKKV